MAIAVVELSDAQDELAHATEHARLPSESKAELDRARDAVDTVISRLEKQFSGAHGVAVAESAEYLGVTPPTVRSWLKRGVLKSVRGKRPIQVTSESLRQTQRLLEELRSRGQDRDWLQSLVDYLHDADARRRPDVRRGLEELRRGQTEPA